MFNPSIDHPRSPHRLALWDGLAGLLILISGTLIGATYAIGPTAWDDTLYLHTALTLTRDPTILNRYFHIAILRLGILLEGGQPFVGAYLAGAFIFSLTAALVYLNARLLSGASHPWHGILALFFLLATPYYLPNFGAILADDTAMAMVSLGLLCFLLSIQNEKFSPVALALNGLIFFLAFKAKESSGALILMLAALLFIRNTPFQPRILASRVLAIFAGIAAGQLLWIAADGVVLGDAWFGLRLADQQALVAFNRLPMTSPRINGTYFNSLAQAGMLAPFCLSMLSAARRQASLKDGYWAVYLMPLIGYAGLILFESVQHFGVIDRYALPALPVLAALAPQWIDFGGQDQGVKPAARSLVSVAFGPAAIVLAVFLASVILTHWVAQSGAWQPADFVTTILAPLGVCLLLIGALTLPSGKTWGFLVLVGLSAFFALPLANVYRQDLVAGATRQAAVNRLAPMTDFKPQVNCTSGQVFVSYNYYDHLDLLSRDQQSSNWMFDLAFNCSTQKSQFTLSSNLAEILGKTFTYAFIPKMDFDALMQNPAQATALSQRYSISSDPQQSYYLLSGK